MSTICVTGAAGRVGRELCQLLVADPEVDQVRALDRVPVELTTPKARVVTSALRDADLRAFFRGADVVCHLAGADPLSDDDLDHDVQLAARVLDAAATCGVGQVIARSSATVYGAWPDNPVPLTETADLRPNPDSPWVQVRSRVEEMVWDFAAANAGIAVAVLRPCVTVSESGPDSLGRVLAAARLVAPTDDAAPVQFVHAADVASAIDLVRRRRAGGVYNVAPDGSLTAETVRSLVGGAPRLRLPSPVARRVSALVWRFRMAPTPPGFVPFAVESWVVASDRLRSLGWEPSHTNDEAFVAGHDAAPWAQISPQRRQELALAVAVAGMVAALAGAGTLLRRRARRRRQPWSSGL